MDPLVLKLLLNLPDAFLAIAFHPLLPLTLPLPLALPGVADVLPFELVPLPPSASRPASSPMAAADT